MIGLLNYLPPLLLLLVLGQQVLADDTLLEKLCNDETTKLDQIASIAQLKREVDADYDDANLMVCAEKYRKYIAELDEIVNNKQDSICSHVAVSRMSRFHWHHVIGQLDRKWSSHLASELPRPLLEFFINFANQVTKKCARELHWSLHKVGNHAADLSNRLFVDSMGKLVDVSRFSIVQVNDMKNAGDFVLLWHTTVDKLKRQGKVAVDEYPMEEDDELTGFKLQDPSKVWKVQDICRNQARPIYQETTLPVMRLINMGYGKPGDETWMEHDFVVQKWYSITQYCELILPIYFYRDPSLDSNVGQVLKSKEEAAGLELNSFSSRAEIGSVAGLRLIRASNKLDTKVGFNQIKFKLRSNINDRCKLFAAAATAMVHYMRENFGQSLKDMMHLGKRMPDKSVAMEQSESFENMLLVTEEFAENEDDNGQLIRDKRSAVGLRRAKRYVTSKWDVLFVLFCLAILIAIGVFALIGLYAILTNQIVIGSLVVFSG